MLDADVFISYRHDDAQWARRRAGVRAFLQACDVEPGEVIVRRIEGAIGAGFDAKVTALAAAVRQTAVPATPEAIDAARAAAPRPDKPPPRPAFVIAHAATAAVLRPNMRLWLMPYLYKARRVPQVHVPDGTIGVIEASGGCVRPLGRRLGRYIERDYFQDGPEVLRSGGEPGRQSGYLPGGAWYSINTEAAEHDERELFFPEASSRPPPP